MTTTTHAVVVVEDEEEVEDGTFSGLAFYNSEAAWQTWRTEKQQQHEPQQQYQRQGQHQRQGQGQGQRQSKDNHKEDGDEDNPAGRYLHASVVLEDDTVVILGGELHRSKKRGDRGGMRGAWTNSVLCFHPLSSMALSSTATRTTRRTTQSTRPTTTTATWFTGPNLNDKRKGLAAVVCNDAVYAIGGWGLDTMERIPVSALSSSSYSSSSFKKTATTMTRNKNQNSASSSSTWQRLKTRLTAKRAGCAAVVVHNRFVIVLGGYELCTVDIIDTMATVRTTTTTTSKNNHNGADAVVVSLGPSMTTTRYAFGAAVLGNQIWVIGGRNTEEVSLKTIESISFESMETMHHRQSSCIHNQSTVLEQQQSSNSNSNWFTSFSSSIMMMTTTTTMPSSLSSLLFSCESKWTIQNDLSLSKSRSDHVVGVFGTSSLVVVGGHTHHRCTRNPIPDVEVIDPYRRRKQQQTSIATWKLPHLNVPLNCCSMVSIPCRSSKDNNDNNNNNNGGDNENKNTNRPSYLLVLGGYGYSGRTLDTLTMESLSYLELSLTGLQHAQKVLLLEQSLASSVTTTTTTTTTTTRVTIDEEAEEAATEPATPKDGATHTASTATTSSTAASAAAPTSTTTRASLQQQDHHHHHDDDDDATNRTQRQLELQRKYNTLVFFYLTRNNTESCSDNTIPLFSFT